MSKIGGGGTQSPGLLPVSESALSWSRDPVLGHAPADGVSGSLASH